MKEISKQYAEAIFELACESGCEDAVMTALDTAREVFAQNPDYMALLSSPAIPLTERLAVVESSFSGRLPEMVVSLLGLMCEKGRIGTFPVCVEEYDLLIPETAWSSPMVRQLIETLKSPAFAARITAMGGYILDHPGEIIDLV